MKQLIYMDYAAATPLDNGVLAAMQPYFSTDFYNPSATYLAGREVAHVLEAAKKQIGQVLGARSSEITFTAGGTEANNLAIHGIMRQFPDGHLITSSIEHESILKPAEQYSHNLIPVQKDGLIDIAKLERSIKPNTVLVSIMYANNEIGTIQPVKEISQLIQKIRTKRVSGGNNTPLYFHTDACQATNYLDVHVSRLGVDMMTLNGGKMYGPKQSGALYIKAGIRLEPLILGGGQEKGLRSGTENIAGGVGFAKALELTQAMHKQEAQRLQALQTLCIELLKQEIPEVVINGSLTQRLPNNVHITIAGYDNERLMMELDERGIMCAVGSACSASSDEPSHVLKAIGLTDRQAQASLRFTMGRNTSEQDVRTTVKTLADCL